MLSFSCQQTRDFLAAHSTFGEFVLLLLSFVPALLTTKEIWNKIREAKGSKKIWPCTELTFLWLLPVFVFLSTRATDWASDDALNSVKVQYSNDLASAHNEIFGLSNQVQEATNRAAKNEPWIRFFEPLDFGNLSDDLKELPKMQVELRYVAGDREQTSADRLTDVFLEADWHIINSFSITNIGEYGFIIGVSEGTNSISAAHLLSRNLKDAKVIEGVSNVPTNSVLIVVCPPLYPAGTAPAFFIRRVEREIFDLTNQVTMLDQQISKLDDKQRQEQYERGGKLEMLGMQIRGKQEDLMHMHSEEFMAQEGKQQNLLKILNSLAAMPAN
jgi:hypothetical protein